MSAILPYVPRYGLTTYSKQTGEEFHFVANLPAILSTETDAAMVFKTESEIMLSEPQFLTPRIETFIRYCLARRLKADWDAPNGLSLYLTRVQRDRWIIAREIFVSRRRAAELFNTGSAPKATEAFDPSTAYRF